MSYSAKSVTSRNDVQASYFLTFFHAHHSDVFVIL